MGYDISQKLGRLLKSTIYYFNVQLYTTTVGFFKDISREIGSERVLLLALPYSTDQDFIVNSAFNLEE